MKKKIFALCAVLILLSGMVVMTGRAAGLMDFFTKKSEEVTISKEEYERLSRYAKMDQILQYIEMYYYQEPDVDAMIENATRGLMYGLDDPYSFYYNEAEWAEMWDDDEGEYAGVGLLLQGSAKDLSVTVIRVFKDTPSERAGIKKGDQLVRVEDIEVNMYSMQNAVNVMRGAVDEIVEIEVLRDGEYLTFQIPRAIIHVNRIEYAMMDGDVGYIALYEFAGESQREFSEAFQDLKSQGAKALIVDLRDNGGGWVDAAVDVADLFVGKNVLVYTEDRYGNREEEKTQSDTADDIPLVFLVNENTASASEILSGSLHDLGRATIVGTQTYGKGIIQAVIPLGDSNDGFQMTIAQYFLPSGAKVHKEGITPDIIVEMPEDLQKHSFALADLRDPQLQAAWDAAKNLIQ